MAEPKTARLSPLAAARASAITEAMDWYGERAGGRRG